MNRTWQMIKTRLISEETKASPNIETHHQLTEEQPGKSADSRDEEENITSTNENTGLQSLTGIKQTDGETHEEQQDTNQTGEEEHHLPLQQIKQQSQLVARKENIEHDGWKTEDGEGQKIRDPDNKEENRDIKQNGGHRIETQPVTGGEEENNEKKRDEEEDGKVENTIQEARVVTEGGSMEGKDVIGGKAENNMNTEGDKAKSVTTQIHNVKEEKMDPKGDDTAV